MGFHCGYNLTSFGVLEKIGNLMEKSLNSISEMCVLLENFLRSLSKLEQAFTSFLDST